MLLCKCWLVVPQSLLLTLGWVTIFMVIWKGGLKTSLLAFKDKVPGED